jgi:hypothetical protein
MQGAWRFYQNPRVTLPVLAEPLVKTGLSLASTECQRFCLIVHDWSPLHYTNHESKLDRTVLYNKNDYGYELQTALLVSDSDGEPLAPLYIGLTSDEGHYSTRREQVIKQRPHLDELGRTIGHLEKLFEEGVSSEEEEEPLPQLPPQVHIVDREGDALLHLRRFVRCERLFLIRSNDFRVVEYESEEQSLKELVDLLSSQLRYARQVQYKGREASQYVAEAEVVLRRDARPQRRDPSTGKPVYRRIKGRAITLRVVVAQVRQSSAAEEDGELLAEWLLWTNVDKEEAAAETIAEWYYWRWRIESFFKLLKRAGQHVEQWQQESAQAVAKRLLVAAQACVVVWQLMRAEEPQAVPLRRLLVRLSGRTMKRGVEYTAPALLAGMWGLLTILDVLEDYTPEEIRQMAKLLPDLIE